MTTEWLSVSGPIARVRDRTVGVEAEVSVGNTPSHRATRYFNEIEIDLIESAPTLCILARWPDRLFLQNGDCVVAAGKHEQDKFQVLALCNLTDGSNYLLSGSPSQRRKLREMLAPFLSSTAVYWLSA